LTADKVHLSAVTFQGLSLDPFRFVASTNVTNVCCYDTQVSIEQANAATLTCGFPGCTRPVLRTGAPGRPSEYCDLPEHTRWRAWRERQRIREAETQDSSVTVTKTAQGSGSSAAHGRAEELTDRIRLLVTELTTSLTGVVQELGTMTDPATVAAELDAVRTEAARGIAQAQAELAKAEQRRRAAARSCEQAEAATQDAIVAAEQAELDVAAAREAQRAAVAEAQEVARRADDEIATVKVEAEDEIAAIRRDAADLTEQARVRAEERIEQAQRAAAEQIADAARQADEQINAAQRERDAAVAAGRAAELATGRAEQSATDAKADTERLRAELAQVRQELTDLHRSVEVRGREQAAGFERDLERQRTEAADTLRAAVRAADERVAALDEVKSQLLARAQRAEAQLDAVLAGGGEGQAGPVNTSAK
jgi:chromosome segregation ATPase